MWQVRALSLWSELGISGGTAIIILIALYFVVKWAVKNGVSEAYQKIEKKRWHNGQNGGPDQYS